MTLVDSTFLDHGGSVGRHIRHLDWSAHALGALARWDDSLRTGLATVLSSAWPGFLLWGEQLHLFFNDACAPLLIHKGDCLGAPSASVFPEVWTRLRPSLQRVQQGASLCFEDIPANITRNDRLEPAWFTFSVSPLRDSGGAVRGVIGSGFDVSAKLRKIARLQQSQARHAALSAARQASMLRADPGLGPLDTLLDVMAIGIAYVDTHGQLLLSNTANRAIWGAHPGLQSLADMSHINGWWPAGSARSGSMLGAGDWPIARVLAGVEACDAVVEIEAGDLPRLRKTIRIQARALRDALGRLLGVVTTNMDITAQVAAERALKASEQKLRSIANVIPQMVWSSDIAGDELFVNDRWFEYTGITRKTLAQSNWRQVVHPGDIEIVRAAWSRSFRNNIDFEIEHRLVHRSGGYRWVLNRAMPSFAEDGHVTHWMGTLTDIHDQMADTEELRAAARRKDEFLAMLAHELRNPLAPISNAAQLLTMGGVSAELIHHASEVIIRQVRHMTALVDDLLDVSRVTRGQVVLERAEIEIDTIMQGAIEQARPLIEARGHQFDYAPGAPGLRLAGDRTRLVQVVANLLNNAAKYTPPGGHITLAVTADAASIAVRVSDNGIGIAADMLPYVFDLFSQAERTPDRAQGGLGLGLALVKSLVLLHGGRVEADSAGLGQGSSFQLRFEMLAGAGPNLPAKLSAVAGVSSATMQGAAPQLQVLIVDDNLDAAQSLGQVLSALGHAVTTTDNPTTALALVAGSWPDAFILDIGLPDIDGYELVRRLRARPERRDALFLALTGYGQERDRALSRAAGFDHHFVKPVDLGALCAVLDLATSRASARSTQPNPLAADAATGRRALLHKRNHANT